MDRWIKNTTIIKLRNSIKTNKQAAEKFHKKKMMTSSTSITTKINKSNDQDQQDPPPQQVVVVSPSLPPPPPTTTTDTDTTGDHPHHHITMIDNHHPSHSPECHIIRPKIHSSEILYTGFLEVQCDTLLLPPTFTTQYKYYKLNSKGNNAVFVVGKTKDDQLIVNKEYRHPTNTDFVYGFPGGLIDRGETPEQAAQRELLEETGYWAPLDQFKRIGSCYPLPGISGLQMYYVAVHDAEKRMEPCLEPSENLVVELMSEQRVDEILTAQMVIEESEEKAQEHAPRALNVDGNFVTALWYYQKHKQLMATTKFQPE